MIGGHYAQESGHMMHAGSDGFTVWVEGDVDTILNPDP
jgi:hypothetical protein